VGRGAIERRPLVGRVHLVYRRVDAVGHVALRVEGRFLAAVLACGPGAVVSHRSAAAQLGLLASDQRSGSHGSGDPARPSRHPPAPGPFHQCP
jgi:hypothetical protein